MSTPHVTATNPNQLRYINLNITDHDGNFSVLTLHRKAALRLVSEIAQAVSEGVETR